MNIEKPTIEYAKIITPFGKIEVLLKPWITGAESEYINQPLFDSLNVTPNTEKGADISKIDMSKLKDMNRRLIEKFVVSVDGKTDNVVDDVFNMHEDDTTFVQEQIGELRKKK